MARPALTADGITYVSTKTVPIDQLVDFPGNPRRHDAAALDDSITALGQVKAIVARELPDGTVQILGGHGTREALARAGASNARVELYRIPDDDVARRIMLALNRTSDRASYDEAALLALLDDFDLTGTGWGESDLDDLHARLDELDQPGGSGPGFKHQASQSELAARYNDKSTRTLMDLPNAVYLWMIDRLAELRHHHAIGTNAELLVKLVADATGQDAPAMGEPQ